MAKELPNINLNDDATGGSPRFGWTLDTTPDGHTVYVDRSDGYRKVYSPSVTPRKQKKPAASGRAAPDGAIFGRRTGRMIV